MAKLSKTEISAIAYEISKEIIDLNKISKVEEEQLIEEFYQTELGSNIKFINEHDLMTGTTIPLHKIKSLAGIKFKSSPSIQEIERKIIINQIECQNIDELIQSVKDIYIKTEE